MKSFIKLTPRQNVIKLFTAVIYKCLQYARVFFPGKPFQPSLMFFDKAGAFAIEEPFSCSTLGQAPGLAHKQETRLERPATDKNSSLVLTVVDYGQKSFIKLTPGPNVIKLFTAVIYSCLQ
jgi:hypothetical protein